MYRWYSVVLSKMLKVSFDADKMVNGLREMSKTMKSNDVPKHITDLIDIAISEVECRGHESYIKDAIKELKKI